MRASNMPLWATVLWLGFHSHVDASDMAKRMELAREIVRPALQHMMAAKTGKLDRSMDEVLGVFRARCPHLFPLRQDDVSGALERLISRTRDWSLDQAATPFAKVGTVDELQAILARLPRGFDRDEFAAVVREVLDQDRLAEAFSTIRPNIRERTVKQFWIFFQRYTAAELAEIDHCLDTRSRNKG